MWMIYEHAVIDMILAEGDKLPKRHWRANVITFIFKRMWNRGYRAGRRAGMAEQKALSRSSS